MNPSAVDRSRLGGWLSKGICSHHTYFYFSGYFPGRLHFWDVLFFSKPWKIKSLLHITYSLLLFFHYLVIQRTFYFYEKELSTSISFYFILWLIFWFACAACFLVLLAPLWNLKSSKSSFQMLLMQGNCRNTNRHKKLSQAWGILESFHLLCLM